MKNIFIIFTLFLCPWFCAQQNNTLGADRYLEKSIKQKKTANILAITGGVLIVAGLIVAVSDDNDFLISSQQFTGIGISTLGIISGLTSIPFYILAKKNKSKSIKISPQAGNFKIINKSYATVGIKITF